MAEAGSQPNPQLIESILVLAAAEQAPDILAPQIKAAHMRKRTLREPGERINADIEWERLKRESERARELQPQMQKILVDQIMDSDGFSDIEKVAYTYSIYRSPDEREAIYGNTVGQMEALDQAAQEGSDIFLNINDYGRGHSYKILGHIAERGLKIEYRNRVGLSVIGAKITVGGAHGYDGAVELIEEPTVISLADFGSSRLQTLPSVGQPDDRMAIGQTEFEKYVAETMLQHNRLLFIASFMTGIEVEIDNPYKPEEIEHMRGFVLDGIESQARAKTLADSNHITLNVPRYQTNQTIEPATHASKIMRKWCELTDLTRGEVEKTIGQRIAEERMAILSGEKTGETWPELEIAQQRLPRVITDIFGVHDKFASARVDEDRK